MSIESTIRSVVAEAVSEALAKHTAPIQREAYKVAEAAEAIGVSADTMRNLVRSGEIPARKCGPNGHLMISRRHLVEWVDQVEDVR